MGLTWSLVPPHDVPLVWRAAATILAKAVERDDGRRTLDSIFADLLTDHNQLWLVGDGKPLGVVVTALLTYPNKKACKVEWLAGERFEEWAHLIGEIEEWARKQGCYGVEIAGRPGLARVMRKFGYEITGFEGRKLIDA